MRVILAKVEGLKGKDGGGTNCRHKPKTKN
jgi:hypothetical protein